MTKRRPRKKKKRVLIALEDKKSAKFYFQKLVKDKGLSGEVVFAKHCGTAPKNVLHAINREVKLQANFEKKWAVIDVDDNTEQKIDEAFKEAKKSGVCVAVSNVCYELWILLHFTPVTAYHSRSDLKKQLNHHFEKNFDVKYEKSSQDVYGYILGKQGDALINAKKLMVRHIQDNGKISPFEANPITTIYQLVEYLNMLREENKKSKFKFFPQDMMSCPLCKKP